jgi:hypothetical protein
VALNDEEMARQRLERLRAGYRRWHSAMYGDGDLEGPGGELDPETQRRMAEALSIPEPETATSCQGAVA